MLTSPAKENFKIKNNIETPFFLLQVVVGVEIVFNKKRGAYS